MSALFPVEFPAVWAERYGIPLHDKYCERCGRLQCPQRPFAQGPYRGILWESHGCGAKYEYGIAIDIETGRKLELVYAKWELT